jgi:hypothetical protein
LRKPTSASDNTYLPFIAPSFVCYLQLIRRIFAPYSSLFHLYSRCRLITLVRSPLRMAGQEIAHQRLMEIHQPFSMGTNLSKPIRRAATNPQSDARVALQV